MSDDIIIKLNLEEAILAAASLKTFSLILNSSTEELKKRKKKLFEISEKMISQLPPKKG